MVDLSVELAGLRLRNPLILASGILGVTGQSLKRVAKEGAGAVTTKSIGTTPREGNKNPVVVELPYGLLNAMGLPNPGIDAYGEEISIAKEGGVPVIGSVFGANGEEFASLAKKMESFGADAVELNVSCPNVSSYGLEIGRSPDEVKRITKAVRALISTPIFVKISPAVDVAGVAAAAQNGGADVVVAINTIPAMAIDVDVRKPSLAQGAGGYSGPGIKPVGLRCVYDISSAGIPVVGSGGILTGRDVAEYLMAGASAVEIGSAVYYRGVGVFRTICDDLADFLSTHGYGGVGDIKNLARKGKGGVKR